MARSKNVVDKTAAKMARITGEVLEAGVKISEQVVRESKPAAKAAVDLGKRGVSKAKQATLKAAKTLKEEGR